MMRDAASCGTSVKGLCRLAKSSMPADVSADATTSEALFFKTNSLRSRFPSSGLFQGPFEA